ncbi:alpha/beta fold hydrolase [Bradyrhizobium brasilense]|uniref:alpha/beta fold hydrolase n=1 Tax=Bradyrhizobium brasilense TaxID=1419277 RepID=UPI0024C021BA|nr:alpha/beta fold hydrolase [Bradyrhizobium brasilense]MCC8973772.1 alpha/beta fold hydrolase [Bradyrhizobium brasilense]
MGGEHGERRLAAVLAADVAGYSRLMGADEEGTLARLKAVRKTLVDPAIAAHRGRIVKTTGDGMLVEFASAVDAVRSAVEVQRNMAEQNASVPSDQRVEFRIGIHVGDIIFDENDIFGEGVNIAARLEGICDSGGICVSAVVFEQVDRKIDVSFRSRGLQRLKNIERPIDVYAAVLNKSADDCRAAPASQQIRYCRANDGVRLAYSEVGSGPPLVKTANWLSHLELDWESPIYRHMLVELAKRNTVLRYDARGSGLSDWDVGDISLDAWVGDLKAVVDTSGLQRFPLFGYSQGCAVSVVFATRYPDRVSKLVLYGGFALGRYKRPSVTAADLERYKATATLMRLGWDSDEPTFRQLLTSQLAPTATVEQAAAFNVMQRKSTSPDNAVRYYETVSNFDVTELLPRVSVPTLVLHVRDDLMVPVEEGRRLAAGIPSARFVALPGRNHALLETDPGMAQFLEEVSYFLETG